MPPAETQRQELANLLTIKRTLKLSNEALALQLNCSVISVYRWWRALKHPGLRGAPRHLAARETIRGFLKKHASLIPLAKPRRGKPRP